VRHFTTDNLFILLGLGSLIARRDNWINNYDVKVSFIFKCNFNYLYINLSAPLFYKPIFKDEFYIKFVSFDIKVSIHVEYEIRRSSSCQDKNNL
jgi:hypothetical protein